MTKDGAAPRFCVSADMPGLTRRGSERRRGGSHGGPAAPIVLLALALAAPAFAVPPADSEASRVAAMVARSSLNPVMRAALRRALRVAVRKLSSATCRQIFSDFGEFWQGRESAEDRGRVGMTLLDGVDFRDGMPFRVCRDRRVLAFTHRGSRAIYLCGEQFRDAAFGNVEYAANILIHEGLHCAGLPENPPTSNHITARVAADCPVPAEGSRLAAVRGFEDAGAAGDRP